MRRAVARVGANPLRRFRSWAKAAEHPECGDTLVEVLIALVVIALVSIALLGAFGTSITASAEHKDEATLESVLKAFVEQATLQLGRQTTTTLRTQVNGGATGVTTLNVNSIPNALGDGDTLKLFSNGLTQNVTVNGAQASSSTPTTITVASFTASSTFPVGSSVIFPKTPTFTACATPTTYSGGGLTFTPVVTSQGTYTASITQVLYWDPSQNKFDANDGDGDDPCDPATTPSPQQQLTATATNTKTGTNTTVDFVVSDPNFDPAPAAAPAFSGAVFADTILAGVPSSFAVSASGSPTPALSETGSGWPSWAILVDNGGGNGVLYFNAPSSAIGHSFTFTMRVSNAANGGAHADQSFTVTVDQAPAITSANTDTIVPGIPMAPFTISTSGSSPVSLGQTGMPSWATFTDNHNGTATLSGTPPPTGETDIFTIGAQNAASSVSQTFTLLVAAPPSSPVFATAATDTVPMNQAMSFTISAAGFPSPAFTEAGALPNGVTFTDNGNGSATLAGTPTISGSFPITLTAMNISGPGVTQNFVLTVNPQSIPAITSPSTVSPACAQAGSTFQFTLIGSDFQAGASVTSTGMTGTVIAVVVDSSHITVVGTGSSSGTYSVRVANPDGGTITKSGAMSVVSGQC